MKMFLSLFFKIKLMSLNHVLIGVGSFRLSIPSSVTKYYGQPVYFTISKQFLTFQIQS